MKTLRTPTSRILDLLANGTPEQRRGAASALKRLQDPDTLPPLLQAADDPDPALRGRAI
ncbi:HEAT repeat domain-containing protein, partial [Nocardioides sp.]|uniref:HEAT repeat domain-containing protein n=1 Tax=Nocardioides sp. TaxID=35761 RepID=UPI0039C99C6D